jgi:ATP-dependent DNA helicase RecQ
VTAPADQGSLNRLARRDELDLETIRRVYAGVTRAASGRWATVDPGALLPFDPEGEEETADPRVAIGLLEQAALLRRHPDAPVTYTVRPGATAAEDDGETETGDWARFAAWAGFDGRHPIGVTVRTTEACAALDLTPAALARVLAARAGVAVREGPRAVCLEVLPAGSDAGLRLAEIMERARQQARDRIAQVFRYVAGGRCRHQLLANHLGEALDPCGSSCDVCTGAAKAQGRPDRAGAPAGAGADGSAKPRSTTSAADALAALQAVRSLPFPMGKTGLGKLLIGSVESRVRADRSASFGALAGLTRGKVEGLLDRLVADGFLHRDLEHEFKLITLTERGAAATLEDLADYESAPRLSAGAVRTGTGGSEDGIELDAEAEALLDRLSAWRRERASRDAMPSYVIAHNSTLREVALARPTSLAALGQVKGFGPARVEKYGAEVLALVAGEDPPDPS